MSLLLAEEVVAAVVAASKCFEHEKYFWDTNRQFRPGIKIFSTFPDVCRGKLVKNKTCLDMLMNDKSEMCKKKKEGLSNAQLRIEIVSESYTR